LDVRVFFSVVCPRHDDDDDDDDDDGLTFIDG